VRTSVWIATAALGCMFFLTQHDVFTSKHDNYTLTTAEFEEAATGGNNIRRAVFIGLAVMGGAMLTMQSAPARAARKLNFEGIAPWLAAGFLAWCCASITWSGDAGMTLRRVIVLVCAFLGAAGLARWFNARELCLIVFSVIFVHMLLGIGVELALGSFTPWQADYRFAGTMHPNTQGVHLVAMCVAAFCLARSMPRHKVLFYAAFAVGAVLILLTKSRTSAAGLVLALGALWLVQTSSSFKFATGVSAGLLLTLCYLFVALNGFDFDRMSKYVFLGRTEDTGTLTGRLPLWTELGHYVAERPLTGYGYNSFWSAERIELVSGEVEWAIRESHNAYIETALGIGVIGVGLLTLAVCAAMSRAAQLVAESRQAPYAFFFAMAAFALAHGLAESMMTMEMFAPFMVACGLLQLTFFRPSPAADQVSTIDTADAPVPVSRFAAMYCVRRAGDSSP